MSGENKKSNRFFLHKNRLQTCINNLQIVLTQQIYEKKQSVVAGLERFRLTDSKGKVDVEARQEDIRKVLDELLNPLGLTYILNSNHIVVKQADAAAPQEKTVIKGKVTDSKGSPLPGVTVRIKGTNIGVVSDNDGHYELTLPAGTDPTLIFSFVGMLSQEAKYTGQRELNIILHENIGGLFHGFLCAALPRHTP